MQNIMYRIRLLIILTVGKKVKCQQNGIETYHKKKYKMYTYYCNNYLFIFNGQEKIKY